MAKQVPFHIVSGLPFGFTANVTLPNGRAWWTLGTEFEVLCQIREADDGASELLLDLKEFIQVTFSAPDDVTIALTMNGSDTRKLIAGGYYDMVMSNTLQEDARAFVISSGPVYRTSLVTSDAEVPNV